MALILMTSTKDYKELTRFYTEYDTKDDMAKALIDYFENIIKEQAELIENGELSYNTDDLFDFIDREFGELVCLERQANCPTLYAPYPAAWVKETIYCYLKSQCPSEAGQ